MGISTKLTLAATLIATPAMATDFTVTGTYSDGTTRYLHIATGDLDGDGVADEGVLRLTCSNGAVTRASVYAPRDVASGQASGKRMHKPFVITKEWGAASPQLRTSKASYDLATMKGARVAKTMAMDDWSEVTVTKLDGACSSGGGMPVVK